jgi:hypothetical protein
MRGATMCAVALLSLLQVGFVYAARLSCGRCRRVGLLLCSACLNIRALHPNSMRRPPWGRGVPNAPLPTTPKIRLPLAQQPLHVHTIAPRRRKETEKLLSSARRRCIRSR